MSIISSLKNAALGAYHQAAFWDHGATYQSYQDDQKRKQQQQQAQQQAAARVQAVRQPNSPQITVQPARPAAHLQIAGVTTPAPPTPQITVPKVPAPTPTIVVPKNPNPQPQAPPQAPRNTPSVPKVIQQQNQARDTLSKLRGMDYNSRVAAVNAAKKDPNNSLGVVINRYKVNDLSDQNLDKILRPVSTADPTGAIGRALFKNTAKLANQTVATVGEIPETIRGQVAVQTHNPEAAAASFKRSKAYEDKMYSDKRGLFGAGTITKTGEEQRQLGGTAGTKKILGTELGSAAEIVPWFIGVGEANAAAQGTRATVTAGARVAGENAAFSGAASVGSQLAENGKVDPKQVFKDTAIGTGIGLGTFGIARGGSALISRNGQKTAQQLTRDIASNPEAVNLYLNTTATPEVRAAVASHLAGNPKALDGLIDHTATRITDALPEVAGNPAVTNSIRQNPQIGAVVHDVVAGDEQALEHRLRALMPGAQEDTIQLAKNNLTHRAPEDPLVTAQTEEEKAAADQFAQNRANRQQDQQQAGGDPLATDQTATATADQPQAYSKDTEDAIKEVQAELPGVHIDRSLTEDEMINSLNDQVFANMRMPYAHTIDVPATDPSERAHQLVDMAHGQKDHFLGAVKNAADNTGAGYLPELERNAVKTNVRRIEEKIRQKGADPTDVLRSTLLISDPQQADAIIQSLEADGYHVWVDPRTGQPDVDNLYENGSRSGYKHVAVKLTRGEGDQVVKELQMMTPQMMGAKKLLGHDIYDVTRVLDGMNLEHLPPEVQQAATQAQATLTDLSSRLYEAAGASSPSTNLPTTINDLLSSGDISIPKLSARDLSSLKDNLNALSDPTLSNLDASSSLPEDSGALLDKLSTIDKTPSPSSIAEVPGQSTREAAANAPAPGVDPNAGLNDQAASVSERFPNDPIANIQASSSIEDLHPEQQAFVQDYADMLKSLDDGARGGIMIQDNSGYGAPTYTRTSEHTPFYRQYYKENGRAPSAAAYVDQAYQDIKTGKADSFAMQHYQDLQEHLGDPERRNLIDSGMPQYQETPLPPEANQGINIAELPKQPQPAQPIEPVAASGDNKAGFGISVKGSPEVSPEVRAKVGGTYTETNNAEMAIKSADLVNADVNKAANQVNAALNKQSGSLTAQEVSDGIALAKHFDTVGDDASHEQAATIYDKLAEHLTAAGQEVQAAALLARQTSAGLYYQARKTLTNNGIEITPELDKALRGKLEAVQASDTATEKLDQLSADLENTPLNDPNFSDKLNSYAEQKAEVNQRQRDIYDFQQVVADQLPRGKGKQVLDTWKAGLLTSPTTSAGNILSNTVESATRAISEPIAVALDKVLAGVGKGLKRAGVVSEDSSFGDRSITLAGGRTQGAAVGLSHSKSYMKTGFDPRDVSQKYNTVDGGNTNKYAGSVFRFLGAQDQPFWYASYNHSLLDQAKTAAINQGIKGEERQNFISRFMLNPPAAADNTAQAEARRSVFGNDTMLNSIVAKARSASYTDEKGVVHKAEGLVGAIVPFSRVPSSVAMRILERSPVGAGSALVKAAKQIATDGQFDQRALVTALSDSTVGTVGALVFGAALVKAGAITLGFPTDAATKNQWAAEGKQPYSIKVGNKWISLNYVQPFGSILAAGAQYSQARTDGKSVQEAMSQSAAAAGKSVVGQSFLQGVSGVLNAIQDPTQSAQTFANNTAGSLVPNIVKRFAGATDSVQRQTNGMFDAIKSGIPGARETLTPKTDTFGNDLPRQSNGWDYFFNPLKPSDARDTPVTGELDRLAATKDGKGGNYAIFPSKLDKTVTLDGVDTKLNPQQRTDLQKSIGQATQSAWAALMQTPEYQAMSDADKHSALQSSYDDIAAAARQDFAAKNNLGQYAQGYDGNKYKPTKLSAKQNALIETGFDPSNYTSGGSGKVAANLSGASKEVLSRVDAMPSDKKTAYLKDPKNAYEYQLSQYENDVKNGKLDDVQQYNKMQELGKAKVQSNYDATTVELYSMSKTKLEDYMSTHHVDQAQVDKLVALDGDLYATGFSGSRKYKNGITSGGGGSGGRGGGKEKHLNIPAPRFGSFGLVAPPADPRVTINSVMADFNKRINGINVLQGTQIAPGSDGSSIQIAV